MVITVTTQRVHFSMVIGELHVLMIRPLLLATLALPIFGVMTRFMQCTNYLLNNYETISIHFIDIARHC